MLVGACLDNVNEPPDRSYYLLAKMGATVVKTLWTNGTRHRRQVYERLKELTAVERYLIRVGPSGRVTADTLFKDVLDAVYEARVFVPVEAITIQLMNEPNLGVEGAWSVEDYVQLYADVVGMSRWESIAVPWLAGPSFGVNSGLTWAEGVFSALNPPGIVVNSYDWVTPITMTSTRWGLGETGSLDLDRRVRRGFFERALVNAKLGGAEFATVFALGSAGDSHGGWPEGYLITEDDCDVLREVGKQVA